MTLARVRNDVKSSPPKSAPQAGIALGLGIAGLATAIFPILSYPCSITALVLANKSKSTELELAGQVSGKSKAAYAIAICSILTTSIVILIALPSLIQRNFG